MEHDFKPVGKQGLKESEAGRQLVYAAAAGRLIAGIQMDADPDQVA